MGEPRAHPPEPIGPGDTGGVATGLGSVTDVVVLALLFLVLPVAELYVIVQVAGQIGFWNTLGVMILVAVLGLGVKSLCQS